jgi:Tfp pilus assembly protein PilE
MNSMNQKGFTVVEFLLTVIALGVFSGVGLYAYNSIKDSQKAETTKVEKATQERPSATVAKSQDKSVVTKSEYFELKELGVKIKTLSTLSGLTYREASEAKSIYNVTTENFAKNDTYCAGFFGQIYKQNGSFKDNKAPVVLLKQFDTYYIADNIPSCVSSSPLGIKYSDALIEAFKTAEEL